MMPRQVGEVFKSPVPPLEKPSRTPTRELPAVKASRKSARFWASIISGAITIVGGGGTGAYLHGHTKDTVDAAVRERTAALEENKAEVNRRLGELETEVHTLSTNQTAADEARKHDTKAILEAIKGERR